MSSANVRRMSIGELNATSLSKAIEEAREIYVSACSAEVPGLPGLLGPGSAGSTITGIFSPILNNHSYADPTLDRRCRTFFLNKELRQHMLDGWVDFCPWTYTRMADWLNAPGRFDAGVVMVSPPDDRGLCSFGIQTDFLPDFVDNIPRLIGVINPNMPRTSGLPGIPLDRFSAVFSLDAPILGTAGDPGQEDPLSDAIAGHVAGLIPDGATLQMGMGRIPQTIAKALCDHRKLRIHSGMIDDNILFLEGAGVLDRDIPVATAVAIGSRDLYDMIDQNPRFCFRSTAYTHSSDVLRTVRKLIAVNAAIQVDLFGQVNSEGSDGRQLASPGGLPDFLKGACLSDGGHSVIALRAHRGRRAEGGIVSRICAPGLVTGPRYDIDVVVTENGVADLRGLSLDQRAQALIGIADPDTRAALADEWDRIRRSGFA